MLCIKSYTSYSHLGTSPKQHRPGPWSPIRSSCPVSCGANDRIVHQMIRRPTPANTHLTTSDVCVYMPWNSCSENSHSQGHHHRHIITMVIILISGKSISFSMESHASAALCTCTHAPSLPLGAKQNQPLSSTPKNKHVMDSL